MAYKNIEEKRAYDAIYRAKNKETLNEKARERRRLAKQKVLEHYGYTCNHCKYSDIRALQIDHINNNGAEERKSLGGKNFSGWNFYEYLIKNNFPDGYQTLCANCNMIKQLGEEF
jgi:hypothetical protein